MNPNSHTTKLQEIDELLSRGVGSFIDPDDSFKNKLIAKVTGEYTKDIVIKLGVDPNRPDIHLGHAVVLRKLRKFQELGCKVIFLIGDYTAQIGDPTGKSKVRPEVEQEEIEKNMKTYVDQVGKILLTDKEVFSWIRNSDWFFGVSDLVVPENIKTINITQHGPDGDKSIQLPPKSFVGKAISYEATRMQKTHLHKNVIHEVTLKGLLWTLRNITHSRLIQRDMFQDRLNKNEGLYMHEMLYPILQGIDSYLINLIYGSCDLEIGGTDQTFNMLIGRDVMKINKVPEQAVLSVNLLVGTDGKEKMSKSLHNYIAITDEPHDMYGKIMSIPDSALVEYFSLCTYTPDDEVKNIAADLEKGKGNPKDVKMRLAREIVATYHGQAASEKAEEHFNTAFKKGGIPEDIEELRYPKDTELASIILETGIAASKTEWRRLVGEGAVTNIETGEKIEDPNMIVSRDMVLRIGKKRFAKILVK